MPVRRPRLLVLGLCLLAVIACSSPMPAIAPNVSTNATATAFPTPLPQDVYEQAMLPEFAHDVDPYLDGNHYWIEISIDVDPVRVNGHERVRYVNHSDDTLNEIAFRLVVNAFSRNQLETVSNLTVNGTPATPSISGGNTVMTVPLADGLAAGKSVELEIDFEVDLPLAFDASYGRIADKGDIVTLASFYPMVSVYERGAWWDAPLLETGDPAYSEVALYDVNVTTPARFTMASSGTARVTQAGSDDTTTYTIVSGPIRDFALVLMREPDLLTDTQNGVTINIWSLAGRSEDDQFALEKTKLALSVFDDKFGEYPYAEFDVVEAPISAAGIEYPGLIMMAENIWDSTSNALEFVLSHEIGHQWWYGMVGNDQMNEPWLDEALADYSVIVYFREGYGDEAGKSVRDFFQRDRDDYIKEFGKELPVGLPVSAYQGRQYATFVYDSGALYYSHLEDEYSAEKVDQMLKAYLQRHQYGLVHNSDMRQITAEFFGERAGQFFDQWVLGG